MFEFLRRWCNHPAGMLGVECKETRTRYDAAFDIVTYHLYCKRCNSKMDIKYATLRNGVTAFLNSMEDK